MKINVNSKSTTSSVEVHRRTPQQQVEHQLNQINDEIKQINNIMRG